MIKEQRIINLAREIEYYKKNKITIRPKEKDMIMKG